MAQGDALASGAKSATFPTAKTSEIKWSYIWDHHMTFKKKWGMTKAQYEEQQKASK
jgi:hypothetical protein